MYLINKLVGKIGFIDMIIWEKWNIFVLIKVHYINPLIFYDALEIHYYFPQPVSVYHSLPQFTLPYLICFQTLLITIIYKVLIDN